MNISSIEVLEGPNIWSQAPTCVARVELAEWRAMSPTTKQELELRLKSYMPAPVRDRRSGEIWDGAARHLWPRKETCHCHSLWAAQTLLNTVGTLHTLSRCAPEFGRVSETCDYDVFLVAIECEEAELSRACFEFAGLLCQAAARSEFVDMATGLQRLRELADNVCLGTTTGALVTAARQRGIPVQRLDPESLIQLGQGAHQRRLQTAITDQTGKIAETISLDKDLTKKLLRRIGVPVPEGRTVENREDAWTAARELGLPVVVKPRNGDYGLGVTLNLHSREQICAAYDAARGYRDEVMVERFASGEQHRITVVGKRVVAAVRRVPPQVLGDGIRTVAALIDQANLDPRRGDDDFTPLNRIACDEDSEAVLSEQGLSLETVPSAGQSVILSRLAHTWAGGEVEDVTDVLHPEVAEQCVRAARVIGLDVAGLDLIAQDLRQPLGSQGGVILEVNAGPAIALHFAPFCEHPRPVCEAILELLFPPGQSSRIPVVLICDDREQSSTGQLLEQLVRGRSRRIGRAAWDGIHVAGTCLKSGSFANRAGAQSVFLCPDVEFAILEQSWESIRREGLAVDRCDVAILADPDRARYPDYEHVAHLLSAAVGHEDKVIVDEGLNTPQKIAFALPQSVWARSISPLSGMQANVNLHDAFFNCPAQP